MRVALLTYSTKPRGGVVHTLNLAEALAEAGIDVTVWSLARAGDRGFFRDVDPRVTVSLVDFPDRGEESVTDRIVRSITLLRDAFRPTDYDVTHAQDCISANAVGPCIRTIHHLDEFTTPVLADCHEKAVVEPYARICVSAAVAAEVRDGWGLTPTVIPNGVRAQRFVEAASEAGRPGRDAWRRRLGRYVLAVGGIEPRKGTIDLVESYHVLRQRFPDLRLVIAGGETLFDYRDYRAAFERSCTDLGVEPVILGAVGDDELPTLMAASEVFAFPSTKEGFGLAAMEALAAGRPVVTRDLPVLREVFGDTVSYASTPDGFAAAMGAELESAGDPGPGRALAASLTWERAARRHVEFYEANPTPR
ncbi:glycosyl transferase family 1 [Mycolicibacterium madagascariense]|uniref:Glycosyl transferase family 1 n=1 Tax=Mycolicibacterium madagascariense TaxID=212765 RepID=A0A7I7XCD1_9MYCO|nr:MSMEG_0565 family glycosyltransferase [Mycolicibacterium madagascariense]MCV7015687.1 MSMEG_0565 family glycosyltransferase [Mycolicibacterium madagascariense]BBZ27102.1 glycosyl transferase family 1 [Mycolicibacterium madagascariense]